MGFIQIDIDIYSFYHIINKVYVSHSQFFIDVPIPKLRLFLNILDRKTTTFFF